MSSEERTEGVTLHLHLLDAAQGHAVQTWTFEDRTRITIGRAGDNDISLADARVSRVHVELVHQDGGWMLRSHGRNGTRLDDDVVSEARLADRAIFQLGASGPLFRFVMASAEPPGMGTVMDDASGSLDFLVIDEQRKTDEVRQIVQGEAFQHLHQEARRLKLGSVESSAGEERP
jgi:pSer/pThr/pTyr-binding forkhead associated (FHA) protein